MSAELDFPPAYGHMLAGDFQCPLINANAIPYAYDVDIRPHKRARLAAVALTNIDTSVPSQHLGTELDSAKSLNGRCPSPPVSLPRINPKSQQRSASVPPRNKPGRKKKAEPVPEDGPFIQESFAFPKQQTWLKPRPRQRKATTDTAKDNSVQPGDAPDQGQTLSLDKDADRIAALIVKKRKENDSKLFRERMSLQQRLHRGEEDSNDKMIAASHEELKRKMELSAKGIFEEIAPREKQQRSTPPESDTTLVSTRQASTDESMPDVSLDETLSIQELDLNNDTHTASVNIHESNFDEQIILADSVESPESHQHIPTTEKAATAYVPYTTTAASYYPSQITATVANQRLDVSTQSAYPQATQLFFSQPRFANHRFNNPHIMWQQPQQPTVESQQQWASQIWQSLPSTSTPILQPSAVVQSIHTPRPDALALRHSQGRADTHQSESDASIRLNQQNAMDFFGVNGDANTTNAETEPTNSSTASTSLKAPASSNSAPSHLDSRSQLPILRSNVNMFTRQARENGVIGGNNNYSEPLNGERRRNMFASRP